MYLFFIVLHFYWQKEKTLLFDHLYKQTWSELLAPLVNMIKEGFENSSALLIFLIFYKK